MKRLAWIGVLFFVTGVATAASGNDLLKQCSMALQEKPRDLDFGLCFGYVDAANSSVYLLNSIAKQAGGHERGCIPDEVTRAQEVRVIVKYLENHPAELHQSAYFSVLNAFDAAWPCPVPAVPK